MLLWFPDNRFLYENILPILRYIISSRMHTNGWRISTTTRGKTSLEWFLSFTNILSINSSTHSSKRLSPLTFHLFYQLIPMNSMRQLSCKHHINITLQFSSIKFSKFINIISNLSPVDLWTIIFITIILSLQ